MRRPFNMYRSFFITAVILLGVSFALGTRTIDLHFDDTYYIIAHAQIYTCFAAFLVLAGLVCVAVNRLMYSLRIAKLHITLTVGAALALMLLIQVQTYFIENIPSSRFSPGAVRWIDITGLMITVMSLLMLASQLLLPINILLGLFKRSRISKQP